MSTPMRSPHTDTVTDAPDTSSTDAAVVVVEAASQTYRTRHGTIRALQATDLRVEEGTVVSLVGPSGCGKSTLLKMLAGLVLPTEGRVLVNGRPAAAGRPDCAIMLQSPVMLPWRTVEQNVTLPAEVQGMHRNEALVRARELLHMVGLDGFEHRSTWELSGGMQQRVSLARLLMTDPAILLMDEPFGALDEFTRERLDIEVARLQHTLQRTVVFVTHNITEAVLVSDEVVIMSARPGRIVDRVAIDLPKPRTPDLLQERAALDFVAEIRGRLAHQTRGEER
jgi:NitT/TauT family transport system ATP-binding protein